MLLCRLRFCDYEGILWLLVFATAGATRGALLLLRLQSLKPAGPVNNRRLDRVWVFLENSVRGEKRISRVNLGSAGRLCAPWC